MQTSRTRHGGPGPPRGKAPRGIVSLPETKDAGGRGFIKWRWRLEAMRGLAAKHGGNRGWETAEVPADTRSMAGSISKS